MALGANRIAQTEVTALSQLRPGEQGMVVRLGFSGPIRRRFAEMGIVRGETIVVERIAPLGDPIMYSVKGYLLSLRREEAAQIEVQSLISPNHHV